MSNNNRFVARLRKHRKTYQRSPVKPDPVGQGLEDPFGVRMDARGDKKLEKEKRCEKTGRRGRRVESPGEVRRWYRGPERERAVAGQEIQGTRSGHG